MATTRFSIRLGLTTAVAAAVVAGGLVGAGPSAAVVKDLAVSPAMGGKYGTGCTYRVTVTAIWGNPTAVIFEDFTENRVLGTSSIVDSKASASWKPQRTGKHLIVARLAAPADGVVGNVASTVVTVAGKGVDLQSVCPVF